MVDITSEIFKSDVRKIIENIEDNVRAEYTKHKDSVPVGSFESLNDHSFSLEGVGYISNDDFEYREALQNYVKIGVGLKLKEYVVLTSFSFDFIKTVHDKWNRFNYSIYFTVPGTDSVLYKHVKQDVEKNYTMAVLGINPPKGFNTLCLKSPNVNNYGIEYIIKNYILSFGFKNITIEVVDIHDTRIDKHGPTLKFHYQAP